MKSKILSVLALISVFSVNAQWDINSLVNTPVSTAILDQQEVRLVSDGFGGAFITWEDFRSNLSFADIYVQRIDKNGFAKWTPNGVNICSNIFDQRNVSISQATNSSAIISWSDARNGNWDIYAQKVDSIGYTQWASNGVPVCVKALNQQDVKSVPDLSGGAYFVWTDSVAGFYDLYAQHLDANGNQLLPAGGLAVCTALDKQINAKIEVDGSGGCIITWMDKRFGDYDIYAQRIDATGNIAWTNNGVLVSSFPGNQSNPKIEPDGAGGAIIAWQDNRNSNDYDVFAQRINSSGAAQWNAGGVGVCTLIGSSQSAVEISTKGGVNGAIIAWKDGRAGGGASQVYMQMLNPSGAAQWTSNGILIGNGINPNLCEDGSGGVIVTWQDSTLGDWNVMGQRVNASGNILWTSGGEKVGNATANQMSPKNVYDGNGGSIFTFQDKRNLADFDIYAHHLYGNGSAVGIFEQVKTKKYSACYPNPVNENSLIVFETSAQQWTLEVFDNLGRIVYSVEVKDTKKVKLSKKLEGGIYFYNAKDIVGNFSLGTFLVE
ncbi:MAG: T9SS type A sorting domain-containing protein [Bacteroidota bacterium]|jgi:hypothetical protein